MTTFLAFVFVLGVLVFVHELGHFLAAKRVGIRVLKFQLGFNPTIVSFRRGDTEYGIGALPLGGYVKMAGESPEDGPHGTTGRVPVEDEVGAVPGPDHGPGDEPRPGGRAAGGRAVPGRRGAGLSRISRRSSARSRRIRPRPRPTSGPAIASLTVADRRVETWEQFFIAVGTRPNREVTITLNREGNELARQVTPGTVPDSKFEIGDIGVLPDVHPHVPSVTAGEPADKAGIKPGDVVLDDQRRADRAPVAARRDHREAYRQAHHRHRAPRGRAPQTSPSRRSPAAPGSSAIRAVSASASARKRRRSSRASSRPS